VRGVNRSVPEFLARFGVGQVQPTFARHQEFASHRRHGIIQVDARAALEQNFGGHQPGRAAGR